MSFSLCFHSVRQSTGFRPLRALNRAPHPVPYPRRNAAAVFRDSGRRCPSTGRGPHSARSIGSNPGSPWPSPPKSQPGKWCRKGGTAERAWHVVFIETVCFSGDDSAIARDRIRKCSARSSGLLLWCLDWLRTSPCPSYGHCWPPSPSASFAGGWPIAATGSDAGIVSRFHAATLICQTQIQKYLLTTRSLLWYVMPVK